MAPLLSVKNLVTSFRTDTGVVRAVDDVSFEVPKGGTVGIVGESGCGKSVTSLSIMRLVPSPGRVDSGEVRFNGQDLLQLEERDMLAVRGRKISMIFQEPMTSLNPVYTVGAQITEVVRLHQRVSRRAARGRAVEMLKLVGIASPEERVDSYPHQLSGGMRQRVMIAMALSCEPELLIADEPTTALDVTIQAQILDLLRTLQQKLEMSVILITHDLGVVAEFAQRMVVMYAGRVVEQGSVLDLFARPRHPYTEGLLKSIPRLGQSRARPGSGRPARLPTIPGVLPDLRRLPPGCRFENRCSYAEERCRQAEPELAVLPGAGERRARCFLADRVGAP
ncbi:MAG TPA: ABC transporter ATP-binding protein [Polyangiaceae bacterium]|nr:ABC transporter ATP-binding protein [Polyangiaceae bacterium]